LDEAAEQYLQETLGFRVDFEVSDALAKLARLGCATQSTDGRWHSVALADTLICMDRAWDAFFSHHQED
jgi:hypothetical protein